MIEVVPAVLPKQFSELASLLAPLSGVAPLVQVDVVNDAVLPSAGAPMPCADAFAFEFDLMLPEPARAVSACLAARARRVVIHAGAGASEALALLQPHRDALEVGIALTVDAEAGALDQFIGRYDYAQVMGIAKVGHQGEPFDPRALKLVAALRAAHPELSIQVDGGVNLDNAALLVAAGASRLVVGSAIVKAADPVAAYRALYTEVNAH